MNKKCAIILAAGKGKRMKSSSPKVLCEVLFKPMLKWVIDSVHNSDITNLCVVAGYKHEQVQEYLNKTKINCDVAIQTECKGTAHAVMMANSFLKSNIDGDVLILGGDTPFVDCETIKNSYKFHCDNHNTATVISANIDNPFGYGRIVRNPINGNLDSIVEQKDASDYICKIKEVNSGAYWFNIKALLNVLPQISNNNAQNEYYLPDAIKLLLNQHLKVSAFLTESSDIILGANDCEQLNNLNNIARNNILQQLRCKGINIPFTDGVIVGPDVNIGMGTHILPGTLIAGCCQIGANCKLGPNSQIINCKIEDNAIINSSCCNNMTIKSNQHIGPFYTTFSN